MDTFDLPTKYCEHISLAVVIDLVKQPIHLIASLHFPSSALNVS